MDNEVERAIWTEAAEICLLYNEHASEGYKEGRCDCAELLRHKAKELRND